MSTITSLFNRIGGETAISRLVDVFYGKMLDDYHINRFFNDKEADGQAQALKACLVAAGSGADKEGMADLLDDFFMKAFARSKRKSFVSGSDFGFLGILIEQDHPETHLLSEAHAHLLKFMPDDSHYDALIENLKASVQQLGMDAGLQRDILAVAESNRNRVLGR